MIKRLTGLIAASTILVAVLVGAVVVVKEVLAPENPFQESTVDRSRPALLKAVTDLAELHAAQGQYQVLVDLEKDTKYVPSFLKGERVVYSATGRVDALVDLGTLGPDAVVSDGTAVRITLPAVRLGTADLDLTQSRVVARDRGLLDRIGGAAGDELNPDHSLFVSAEGKVTDAARDDQTLRQRAETNVRSTITALAQSLGFTTVTIDFARHCHA